MLKTAAFDLGFQHLPHDQGNVSALKPCGYILFEYSVETAWGGISNWYENVCLARRYLGGRCCGCLEFASLQIWLILGMAMNARFVIRIFDEKLFEYSISGEL